MKLGAAYAHFHAYRFRQYRDVRKNVDPAWKLADSPFCGDFNDRLLVYNQW